MMGIHSRRDTASADASLVSNRGYFEPLSLSPHQNRSSALVCRLEPPSSTELVDEVGGSKQRYR